MSNPHFVVGVDPSKKATCLIDVRDRKVPTNEPRRKYRVRVQIEDDPAYQKVARCKRFKANPPIPGVLRIEEESKGTVPINTSMASDEGSMNLPILPEPPRNDDGSNLIGNSEDLVSLVKDLRINQSGASRPLPVFPGLGSQL